MLLSCWLGHVDSSHRRHHCPQVITKEVFPRRTCVLVVCNLTSSQLDCSAIFIVIYCLTWLLGLGSPDWQLAMLVKCCRICEWILPPCPPTNPAFRHIHGERVLAPFRTVVRIWRRAWLAWLSPAKLLPLGKVKAYLLLGCIWGFWHAPLILMGFNYPGYPLLALWE